MRGSFGGVIFLDAGLGSCSNSTMLVISCGALVLSYCVMCIVMVCFSTYDVAKVRGKGVSW